MKVIHVAGWSGSGKTTFIRDLLTSLAPRGKTGSIKHIRDHIAELPAGKDTTIHFEAGSFITAGIDQEKTLITCRSVSLTDSLDILADTGVKYAVVEGFKKIPFTKVLIGDLDVPALIRNPTVSDVLANIDLFDEYYTLGSLLREMEDLPGIVRLCLSGCITGDTVTMDDCLNLEAEIFRSGGSIVRVRHNRSLPDSPGRFFVVCLSEDIESGSRALSRCRDFFVGANSGAGYAGRNRP